MGRDVPALVFTREDRRQYRDKMHTCLDVLEQMLRESGFESERPRSGWRSSSTWWTATACP